MNREQFMDEMIVASERRVEQLRADLKEEEFFLSALRKKRGAAPEGEIAARTPPSKAFNMVYGNPPTHEGPDRLEEGRMPQAIMEVLREAPGPLSLKEITVRIEARGLKSPAKKGTMAVVSSSLGRRDDLFVRVARGQYDLAERVNKKTTHA